jgi:hypothetical protein
MMDQISILSQYSAKCKLKSAAIMAVWTKKSTASKLLVTENNAYEQSHLVSPRSNIKDQGWVQCHNTTSTYQPTLPGCVPVSG